MQRILILPIHFLIKDLGSAKTAYSKSSRRTKYTPPPTKLRQTAIELFDCLNAIVDDKSNGLQAENIKVFVYLPPMFSSVGFWKRLLATFAKDPVTFKLCSRVRYVTHHNVNYDIGTRQSLFITDDEVTRENFSRSFPSIQACLLQNEFTLGMEVKWDQVTLILIGDAFASEYKKVCDFLQDHFIAPLQELCSWEAIPTLKEMLLPNISSRQQLSKLLLKHLDELKLTRDAIYSVASRYTIQQLPQIIAQSEYQINQLYKNYKQLNTVKMYRNSVRDVSENEYQYEKSKYVEDSESISFRCRSVKETSSFNDILEFLSKNEQISRKQARPTSPEKKIRANSPEHKKRSTESLSVASSRHHARQFSQNQEPKSSPLANLTTPKI